MYFLLRTSCKRALYLLIVLTFWRDYMGKVTLQMPLHHNMVIHTKNSFRETLFKSQLKINYLCWSVAFEQTPKQKNIYLMM